MLLENDADVDYAVPLRSNTFPGKRRSHSPLRLAVKKGDNELARLLLEFGTDPNAVSMDWRLVMATGISNLSVLKTCIFEPDGQRPIISNTQDSEDILLDYEPESKPQLPLSAASCATAQGQVKL